MKPQIDQKFDRKLAKNRILVKDRNFSAKSKFRSKIEILVRNRRLSQKSNF